MAGKGINLSDPAPGTRAAKELGLDAQLGVVAIDGKRMNGSLAAYCSAISGKNSGDTATVTILQGRARATGPLPIE